MRRSVLLAAEADSAVDPVHIEAALTELSESADALNRAILGGRAGEPPGPAEGQLVYSERYGPHPAEATPEALGRTGPDA